LPLGRVLELQYREVIGLHILLYGSFEPAELTTLCSLARLNTTAVDVGANVGMFTIALSAAVGPSGHVMAFEPFPPNLDRLQRNLHLNEIRNVDVLPLAVDRKDGATTLHLSNDPAFHSTTEIRERERSLHETITVPMASLDGAWTRAGSPAVSVLKIDVEGGEFSVLSGATVLLAQCRPTILIEVPREEQLQEITTFLQAYGYHRQQPDGFMPWNYLFTPEDDHRSTRG
jgi:FkbM family methyltransferase